VTVLLSFLCVPYVHGPKRQNEQGTPRLFWHVGYGSAVFRRVCHVGYVMSGSHVGYIWTHQDFTPTITLQQQGCSLWTMIRVPRIQARPCATAHTFAPHVLFSRSPFLLFYTLEEALCHERLSALDQRLSATHYRLSFVMPSFLCNTIFSSLKVPTPGKFGARGRWSRGELGLRPVDRF